MTKFCWASCQLRLIVSPGVGKSSRTHRPAPGGAASFFLLALISVAVVGKDRKREREEWEKQHEKQTEETKNS